MKPVCVPCQRFYRAKKNGYYFIECMPIGGSLAPPGKRAPDLWEPYKLWAGDLWECPDCKAQIVSGFGAAPMSEHYKENFTQLVEALGAERLRVKDC